MQTQPPNLGYHGWLALELELAALPSLTSAFDSVVLVNKT